MSTPKPTNEIVVAFAKDRNDCVIVVLFDVHGETMQSAVKAEGFSTRLTSKDAIRQTGKIGSLVKRLGLERNPFVANGHQYYSYVPAIVGSNINVAA